MKFGWKQYTRPTPDCLKNLGDSLLAVSTFLASLTLIEGWSKWIALGVGKFLTKFFGKKDINKRNNLINSNMTRTVKVEVFDYPSGGLPPQPTHQKTITYTVPSSGEVVMPAELDTFIVEHVGGRPGDRG